jgi:hypothetical protein
MSGAAAPSHPIVAASALGWRALSRSESDEHAGGPGQRRAGGPGQGHLCLTARQELPRQRVGLASQDNADTHDSNACPASTRPQDCASVRPARTARPGRRSYKLHIGGIGGGLEPAASQATQWRLRWRTGDVALGHWWSRRTSREPVAGVMDRRRSGQSSESRSLRTAGLGQPVGPRH